MKPDIACEQSALVRRHFASVLDREGAQPSGAASIAHPFIARRRDEPASTTRTYTPYFETALSRLKSERRYRTFAELERIPGRFPAALWHGPNGPSEVTVWLLQRLSRHGPASLRGQRNGQSGAALRDRRWRYAQHLGQQPRDRGARGGAGRSAREGRCPRLFIRLCFEPDRHFIDSAVDPASGTVLVKATLAHSDAFWPGQYASVDLTLGLRPEAVTVPLVALQLGNDRPHVFVVQSDSTVALRAVEPIDTSGGEALIGKGLVSGERVVVEGHHRLRDGSAVSEKVSEAAALGATESRPVRQ
jgi:hypothetical protein